jgi:hypothetical protein
MGPIILTEGIIMDPEKMRAVWEWPLLKDKHKLRSFFCLCTYCRRFVDIAKLLTQFIEEKCTFQRFAEAEATF